MARKKDIELQKVRQQQDKRDTGTAEESNPEVTTPLLNKRVLIFIPSVEGKITLSTTEGLFQLLWDCWKWREKGFEFVPYFGARMTLPSARNEAVNLALAGNFDYMIFMDDDMVIPVGLEVFTRLINHRKDIIAPLFFVRSKPYLPLLFKKLELANGAFITYENILDYPKNTLVKCDGVGFGFILINVDVFRKLKQPYFAYDDQYGEDLRFCNEAGKAGYEIFCDTSMQIGHISQPPIIFEEHFESERGGAEEYCRQKHAKAVAKADEFSLKADLIMPCYKNLEITKVAIESILNNTANVNYKLIVVNDGADPGIKKYIKQLKKWRKNICYLESKEQKGATASVNLALGYVTSAYTILLNNDIEIPPTMQNWLFRYLSILIAQPEVGAVGGLSNNIFGMQHYEYTVKYSLPEHFVKVLIPLCMGIRTEAIKKVGLFDERFTLPNKIGLNQDLDYCIRLRKAGYKLKVIRDVFIIHKGQQSQSQCGDISEAEKITRQILIDKWGEDIVSDTVNFPDDQNFLFKGE